MHQCRFVPIDLIPRKLAKRVKDCQNMMDRLVSLLYNMMSSAYNEILCEVLPNVIGLIKEC